MVESAAIAIQRVRAANEKRRRRDVEGPVHRSVLAYLRQTLPHGFIVHHSPNGGSLKGEVGRAKGLGTLAGWPDITIVGKRDEALFLGFMEAKAPNGRLSEDQRKLCDALVLCGAPVRIVRSVEDARKAVSDWRLPSLDAEIREARA